MENMYPVIICVALGLIFGALLSFASKKFYVEPDTRISDLEKLLPNVNCGACGHPGCHAMAEAIIENGEDFHKCKPLKDPKPIADFLASLQKKEAAK